METEPSGLVFPRDFVVVHPTVHAASQEQRKCRDHSIAYPCGRWRENSLLLTSPSRFGDNSFDTLAPPSLELGENFGMAETRPAHQLGKQHGVFER